MQRMRLEATIVTGIDSIARNPAMLESFVLHKKAKEFLKPYIKKHMPEFKVRELIHETGFPTFPRPKGIPENFLVRITENGIGMEYFHPTNSHFGVRVMPGKLHSPNLCQQKPYVIQKTDRGALDKTGAFVSADASEAHIPLDEFIYKDYIK